MLVSTKLKEHLSWVGPKIESQTSDMNLLVLRSISALHFVTLLPEMHM